MRTSAMPRWVSFIGYAVALVLLLAAGEHEWSQRCSPPGCSWFSIVILFTRPPVVTAPQLIP